MNHFRGRYAWKITKSFLYKAGLFFYNPQATLRFHFRSGKALEPFVSPLTLQLYEPR